MSGKQGFIVVYKSNAPQAKIDEHIEHVRKTGGEVGHRYDSVFKGFSAQLKPEHVQSFQGNDLIDYIEPDGVVTTQ
ncbi:hypothetical protein FRC02_005832 [Tulasnella sp. 418]|nr:hypothetical protein FRC02_005832 [Tulasnella sp. 418]